MVRLRFLLAITAAASLTLGLSSLGMAQAQAPAPAQMTGKAVALQLAQSLQSLQTSMGALDAGHLHIAKPEKQAVADGQAAVARNLSQAMPALLQAFSSAPGNLGAAFKLYQDGEAVLAVAQRSGDVLGPRDDAAGGAALRTSTAQVESSLKQLGEWIESRGQADYRAQLARAADPATGAKPVRSAPPATLVIANANGAAKPQAKAKAKKKTKPQIPHWH
ncbi:MAG: hypothetical protein ACRD04_10000 [Terriglobales bacterium]